MLYIEDFLELIEPFPQEIRERLTEMREIDLQIQNETDKLDDRIQVFFHQCKRQRTDWKNENYEEIRREYLKLLESAEDKVQIANQLYDLIEKYLKKLDQELQKFKLELEADHAGITSKLEQVISSTSTNLTETSPISSSLTTNLNAANISTAAGSSLNIDDSDFTLNTSTNNDLMMMMYDNHSANTSNMTSHKRKHSNIQSSNVNNDEDSSSSWNSKLDTSSTSQQLKSNATFHFSTNKKISSLINTNTNNNINNKKGICFNQSNRPDTNLIKLIRNNQNLNRRTSSSTNNKTPSTPTPLNSSKKQRKKKLNDFDYEDDSKYDEYDIKNDLDDNDYTDDMNEDASETATSENDVFNSNGRMNDDYYDSEQSSDLDNNDETTSDELDNKMKLNKRANQQQNRSSFKDDWNSGEDTNQRYCVCKDFSYGDMIMCDNSKCETQWFHFVCVGLNSAPKGKWFCPSCVESKKKKKEKLTINNMGSTIGQPSTSSSSSFISITNNPTSFNLKPTTDSNHQSTNPFLSSSSSFSINFNDKTF